MESLELLSPRPRALHRGEGTCPLAHGVHVTLAGTSDERARAWLVAGLAALGVPVVAEQAPGRVLVTLELGAGGSPTAGSYRLRVDDAVRISAGGDAGLFHGAATLLQLARAARPFEAGPRSLPAVEIEDEPDFRVRGAMLDISRDRVPTMETLLFHVDLLAAHKVNHLQLYMEHTFAFAEHELVWRDASPFTGAELEELAAYCRARHVELVPNLQSFGHWHRWLAHPEYAHLAECPAGVEHPFHLERQPFSLCPTDPAVPQLLGALYDELLPHVPSRLLHVGGDETFDLGQGRSRAACEERGQGRVYLEFLERLAQLARERGRRMLFWGDVIVTRPELVAELPGDAVALEWGYDAGHPFDEHAARFAASGLEFWVCPGTSSWQSLVGRTSNMRANLREAAAAGRRHGARGLVVTDWGDWGHWQPAPVAWPGLVEGAARAWNGAVAPPPLADVLDVHVLGDPARVAGRTLLALGDLYLETGAQCTNGAPWYFVLRYPHEPFPHERLGGCSAGGFARAQARGRALLDELGAHRMPGAEGALVEEELRHATEVALFGCRLGRARHEQEPGATPAQLPADAREALARELRALVARHRELWTRRSRPGGLDDSAARYEHVLSTLEG